jgi:hypothetical protein
MLSFMVVAHPSSLLHDSSKQIMFNEYFSALARRCILFIPSPGSAHTVCLSWSFTPGTGQAIFWLCVIFRSLWAKYSSFHPEVWKVCILLSVVLFKVFWERTPISIWCFTEVESEYAMAVWAGSSHHGEFICFVTPAPTL